jgi:hypothetical protein
MYSRNDVKYWLYQYCRYWKILENTGYTSIADIGRLGRIPVNPSFYIKHTILEAPVFFIQQYW